MGRSRASQKPTKPPKQKNRVQCVAKPNIREVNWNRDIPGDVGVPQHVRERLTGLSIEHTSTRQQLDILRKTRGTRDVGALKVPAHLSAGIPMGADDAKDKKTGQGPRPELAVVLPAEE